MRCDFPLAAVVKPGKDHPWTVLSIRLEQPGPRHAPVPAAVQMVVNPDIAQTYARMRDSERSRSQFSAQLSLLTGGSVYTILVPKASAHPHCEQADGESMFGVVVVFPWAVDLLYAGPKCAMTDTTFRAVKPYTLAVLHLIFANESIPIAFSVSPSETWLSYSRIYYLLLERLQAVSEVAWSGQPPPALGTACPPGGWVKWPEDPPDAYRDDLGEAPPPAANPDEPAANPDETASNPDRSAPDSNERQYLEFDEKLFPPCAEIKTLPAVPQASPVYPRPLLGLVAVCAPLLRLPIVTDQGKALEKFVNAFRLDWKLCHRHIIESIGAKGEKAAWVLRILRCFSRDEFLRTRMAILREMNRIRDKLEETDKVYIKILRLLGLRPSDASSLCDINHWALWLRLGCPRTTNSAESVNGHLNAEIEKTETWVERVISVAKHFMRRYHTRADWRDRSLKRNLYKCYPNPDKQWYQSQAETDFYLHLHDAFGKTREARLREGFPDARWNLWWKASFFIEITQAPKFPDGWDVERPLRRRCSSAADEEATKLEIEEASAHTAFARMAWQILWTLRRDLGAAWKKCAQTVNVVVIRIGRDLGILDDRVTWAQEADWWSACWKALDHWTRH
jgi:hypothetical protein